MSAQSSTPAPPAAGSILLRFRPTGWGFTVALVGVLAARRLLTEGLFGDGLAYAAIARNLAEGRGAAWAPHFSHSFWLPYNHGPVFYDHPPLQFWLQAGLFRLLGDTPFTEKAYGGLVVVLTALLLAWLWRGLLPEKSELRAFDWLPVLLWGTFRTVEWANGQNLLDSTMTLFCLLAVGCVLSGFRHRKRALGWDALAAVALLLAFLAKGPVSLHVLAAPGVLGYFWAENRAPAPRRTLTLGVLFGAGLGALLLYEPARHFLQTYLQQQLWASLAQTRENTAQLHALGRWYVLQVVVLNALPALGLGGLLHLTTRRRSTEAGLRSAAHRVSWVGLVLTFAVCLPMAASVKQYHHYAVPAFPYLALALAGWLAPKKGVTWLETRDFSRKTLRLLNGLAVGACLAALGYCGWIAGKPFGAERKMVEDVHALGRYVPRGATVGVCPRLMRSMTAHAYLQRYHRIELTGAETLPAYILTDETCRREQAGWLARHGYQRLDAPLRLFFVFRKKPEPLISSDVFRENEGTPNPYPLLTFSETIKSGR